MPTPTPVRLGYEETGGEFNYLVELTHEHLTDTDAQQVIALLNVEAGDCVVRCAMKLQEPFNASDATLISIAAKVGDGGDDDRYLTSTELCVDGTEIDYKAGPATTQFNAYLVADTVDVTIDGTTAKSLADANVGTVYFLFKVVKLEKIGAAII